MNSNEKTDQPIDTSSTWNFEKTSFFDFFGVLFMLFTPFIILITWLFRRK